MNYSARIFFESVKNYSEEVIRGFLPGCSGTCLRKNTALKQPFREDLKILLDVEFFIRMSWCTKVVGVGSILSDYRIYEQSTLHSSARQAQKDLLEWWGLFEEGKIEVPDEILSKYRTGLFKRIVAAFLQDIWMEQIEYAESWKIFIEKMLNKYPYLYVESFSLKGKIIYLLFGLSNTGKTIAIYLVFAYHKIVNITKNIRDVLNFKFPVDSHIS